MGEQLEQSTLRIPRTPALDFKATGSDDAQLVVLVGHAPGRRYIVGAQLELGRGANSPIEILDDGVSREHARVVRQGTSYSIEDLGSRNGTFVNGERVERETLRFGDKISVGSRTVLLFANRDRFEDQRLQAQKLQALGQLAGGIAHDFNNLLGVVLANTTHLQEIVATGDPTVTASLSDVETAARRAVDLTRQLLAFARSGQRRHEPVTLSNVMEDAERLLRRTLHRSVHIELDARGEPVVVGDSSQLLQVVMNLCINAGDAMPEGGKLRIELERVRFDDADLAGTDLLTPGDFAVLRVCDDGLGMPPEVRARAFEPFFTTKPRGKGTGLGLATAQAIARDHGGHLRVDSVPGVGTTFELLIPCGSAAPPLDSRSTERRTLVFAGVVLLADDEDMVRTATRRVLEHAGMQVLEAVDGSDAVDQYSANADRVDLVILDLDMPKLDGGQAFARLNALNPELPVLISSGYIDGEREEALRAAGVDGFLPKPYDSITLMRAVSGALLRRFPESTT